MCSVGTHKMCSKKEGNKLEADKNMYKQGGEELQ